MKMYMKENVPVAQVEKVREILKELPELYRYIDDELEWIDVELEDYINDEIDVSDEYIRKVMEIVLNTKASLINVRKDIQKGINNLTED